MRFAILTLMVLGLASQPSFADSGSSGGGIDVGPGGGSLTVGLTVSFNGAPGVAAGSSSAQRPYKILSFPLYDHSITAQGLCANPAGFQGLGWNWDITVISNSTGLIVSHRIDCIALHDPDAPGPPPATAAPPQPPTIGEIWQTAGIPNPALGVSPADEGVTGLDTWVWTNGPDTIAINAAFNGWIVTGIATRTDYAFDGGDGQLRSSAIGGSLTQPAFTYVFETKGERTLRIASRWTATLTMSGPGLPPTPTSIGTATLTTGASYPIVEIRSILTR